MRTNRTDAATGRPARANANASSLSATTSAGKPTTSASAYSHCAWTRLSKLTHDVASSSTENNSTVPTPRTSVLVGGPKPTSSRTRS